MSKENLSLRNFLVSIGISKIYIENELSINDVINKICISNTEDNLSLEIEKLKKIIEEKSIAKVEEKEKFIISNKVIAVTGNYGSGKSLVTTLLAKAADKQGLKVIIIDFDIFNNSINTLFKLPKYSRNQKVFDNINECVQKINNNLYIFCGVDLLFNEKNKISYEKVKELLENLENDYDLILIDTSSEMNLKYIRAVLANVDKVIFLLEPNLLEIKKAKRLLEIYLEDWDIPNYKIEIIINKANINSIDEEIIKNLFSEMRIIGKINLSTIYTLLANNIYVKPINLKKYEKILKKI